MSFFGDVKLAISHYPKAVQLVREKGMGKLFLYTALAYLVVTLLFLGLLFLSIANLADYIEAFLLRWEWMQWYKNYSWISSIFRALLFIGSYILLVSFLKYVFLAVASPLYAYISEQSEELITGQNHPFQFVQLLRDIVRGIKIALINFIKQFFWTILLLLLSFVPIVGLLSPILLIIVDSYYYGFSMLDYSCERHKMPGFLSRYRIYKRKGLAVGNGLVFYFSILIPVVGLVFIAPLSAIAASITFHETNKIA
jgi:CysZ protein